MFSLTVLSYWMKPQNYSFDTREEADECASEMKNQQYKVIKNYD